MSEQIIGKILAVLCALLWAGAVILFKRSGESIKPLPLNFFKSLVSAILFLPFFVLLDQPIAPPQATPLDYLRLIGSGILGIMISDTLFFMSLNRIGAGLSAIVDCMYSPILVSLSWLLLAEPVRKVDLVGGVIIVSAVFIASFHRQDNHLEPKTLITGVILGISAMLTLGFGVMLMQPILERSPMLWVTELRLLAGAFCLGGVLAIGKDRRTDFASILSRRSWKFTIPAAIMGTNLAMIAWVAAFKLTDVTSAAILNQTSTVFTVLLAALFLHEKLTLRRTIAVILAMAGAVLVIAA